MAVRVETLAERGDAGDAVLLQKPLHLAARDLDALDQRLDRLIAGIALLRRNGVERTLQVVADDQHVAGELAHRIFARVGDVALGAAAEVVHVGRGAEQPVGEVRLLRLQPLDFDRAFRKLLDGLLGRRLLARGARLGRRLACVVGGAWFNVVVHGRSWGP